MTTAPLTIRLATAADAGAIDRLAQLDSLEMVPAGPLLLAERDGELVAARSLSTKQDFADPFKPTALTRRLLALHARQARPWRFRPALGW